MEKISTVVIKDLWNIDIENRGAYGSELKITLTGRNTKGKKVKITVNAEMFFAESISIKSKKAVKDFTKRAVAMSNKFDLELANA